MNSRLSASHTHRKGAIPRRIWAKLPVIMLNEAKFGSERFRLAWRGPVAAAGRYTGTGAHGGKLTGADGEGGDCESKFGKADRGKGNGQGDSSDRMGRTIGRPPAPRHELSRVVHAQGLP